MSNELMITSREFKNTKLRNYTEQIYKQGVSIKKSYARIAATLAKIDMSKCYEMDGFSDVHDYAQQVLGLKKSTSYSFLKIGYEYIDSKSLESVLKHDEGNDFSISQLQVILPLKSVETAKELAERNEINPNMTVKEIKEVVKGLTGKGKEEGGDSHEVGDEVIEVEPQESNRYTIKSVLELAVDNNGKTTFIYADEMLSFRQAMELITEWAGNKEYAK